MEIIKQSQPVAAAAGLGADHGAAMRNLLVSYQHITKTRSRRSGDPLQMQPGK